MKKRPLFRKMNTTAHGVRHGFGGDFSQSRNSKRLAEPDAVPRGMGGAKQRGLDYTPLFKFLLSKVGSPWSAVHAEAVSRLDRAEPISWLVALRPQDERAVVRMGESSYFSGLRVDEDGLLQRVDPALGPSSLPPSCGCCTHTFNGVRFTRLYDPDAGRGQP